jgi:hypothetical protein
MGTGGVGGASFAMPTEPRPSKEGVDKLVRLYKEQFDVDLEPRDAYQVLQRLMALVVRAEELGIAPEEELAPPAGDVSASPPDAPVPAPKARAPRWDRGMPSRKNRRVSYTRSTPGSSGPSTGKRPRASDPGEFEGPCSPS